MKSSRTFLGSLLAATLFAAIPQANTVEYLYDSRGRLERVTYGDGSTVTYTYDNAGNRTAVVTSISDNQAPVANADAVTVAAGQSIVINPLANDTDPDNNLPLALVSIGTPTLGTAVQSGNAITYTAGATAGSDTFSYIVRDSRNGRATGQITVTINTNTAPDARNDSYFVLRDSAPANLLPSPLANDFPATGLTITGGTQPSSGIVSFNPTWITFQPAPGFTGQVSFDYTVTDSQNRPDTATITVNVGTCASPITLVADPVFDIEATETAYTAGINLTPSPQLNDTPQPITMVPQTVDSPKGIAYVNATWITYVPDRGTLGADSFTYTVQNAQGCTAQATALINIFTNDPAPMAVADSAQVDVNSNGNISPSPLANDTGVDFQFVVGPPQGLATQHGVAYINATWITYVPNNNYAGADSIPYTIRDKYGRTSSSTVSVTVVDNRPPAPIANADTHSFPMGGAPANLESPRPIANDTGTNIHYVPANVIPTAAGGAAYVNYNGTADWITYQVPNATFVGTDSFSYTIRDSFGRTSSATVTVNVVDNRPPSPVAAGDSYSFSMGGANANLEPSPLTNDTGTSITMVSANVGTSAGGVAYINPTWVTYQVPSATYTGTDSFSYTIQDSFGRTSSATITVNVVDNRPPAPVANGDSYSFPTGGANANLEPSPLTNDTGTSITMVPVTVGTSAGGVAYINSTWVTYQVPNATYAGPDSFSYTIQDSYGRQATATVSVNVQ